MNVVVTGAAGFVGRWLVRELLSQNDEVTVIVRERGRIPKEWETEVNLVEVKGGLLDALGHGGFQDRKFDIFFHLAWDGTSGSQRTATQMQMENVQCACDAVQLATELQCSRFVNAGSIMEYEAMQSVSQEGVKPGAGGIYGIAKLTADLMAKALAAEKGISYINAIISNIYGVGERSSRFLNTTLRKMLRHEAIPLTHGNQLYDFIYVTDAAKAIALAGKMGEAFAAYYIGNPSQRPLKEFILQMKEVSESRSELLFGKVPFSGGGLTYQEFDTGNTGRLGFEPEVSFTQGIKMTQAWIMEDEYGQ